MNVVVVELSRAQNVVCRIGGILRKLTSTEGKNTRCSKGMMDRQEGFGGRIREAANILSIGVSDVR